MRIRFAVALLTVGSLQAGDLELKPETLKAWDQYVNSVKLALKQQLKSGKPFLRADEDSARAEKLRSGEIIVIPAAENNPKRVASGLIHDWIGAVFMPNTNIETVLAAVRDYSRYKEIYKPGVLDSKLLRHFDSKDEFTLTFRNGSYFKKTALDGTYESSYVRIDANKYYSITKTLRMQEIEDYHGPEEHRLPIDQGHGYIWRVCSINKLEERDDGVFAEVEAIALSRDLPAALRWIAAPIIRRVARESLSDTMRKTRAAVASQPAMISDAAKAHAGTGALQSCAQSGSEGCLQ